MSESMNHASGVYCKVSVSVGVLGSLESKQVKVKNMTVSVKFVLLSWDTLKKKRKIQYTKWRRITQLFLSFLSINKPK